MVTTLVCVLEVVALLDILATWHSGNCSSLKALDQMRPVLRHTLQTGAVVHVAVRGTGTTSMTEVRAPHHHVRQSYSAHNAQYLLHMVTTLVCVLEVVALLDILATWHSGNCSSLKALDQMRPVLRHTLQTGAAVHVAPTHHL